MRFFILLTALFHLISCGNQDATQLKIGVISGPEAELAKTARDVANQRYGLRVKIIEFSDYNLPNEALEDGALDANAYQHAPYLKAAMKAHGYHLKAFAKTFIYPAAIYSSRHKSLDAIPDKGVIVIPNDPSNEARALLLLQKAGLITINNDGHRLSDITENPKHLKIKELDAAQLPRILQDVDAAVINTTFAITAGLHPKTALFVEGPDSPYANLIVIKENSKKIKLLNEFVKAFQSQEVMDKAKELFQDAAIPAWRSVDNKNP